MIQFRFIWVSSFADNSFINFFLVNQNIKLLPYPQNVKIIILYVTVFIYSTIFSPVTSLFIFCDFKQIGRAHV